MTPLRHLQTLVSVLWERSIHYLSHTCNQSKRQTFGPLDIYVPPNPALPVDNKLASTGFLNFPHFGVSSLTDSATYLRTPGRLDVRRQLPKLLPPYLLQANPTSVCHYYRPRGRWAQGPFATAAQGPARKPASRTSDTWVQSQRPLPTPGPLHEHSQHSAALTKLTPASASPPERTVGSGSCSGIAEEA